MKIVNETLKIFVDDVNGVFHPIEEGMEFVEGELKYNANKAITDQQKNEDERTMEIIKEIANSIEGMIQMTIDFPTNHQDLKVPMLDVKVWINSEVANKVFYEFFEKPTKSVFVISKNSAMPLAKKIDALSQGVFRRLQY